MGTNYYTVPRKPSLTREVLHIGKASAGWKFAFQGYLNDDLTIKSFEDWVHYIQDNDLCIFNEYNEEISLQDFIDMVIDFQNNDNENNFTRDVNVSGFRFYFGDFS